MTSIVKTKPEYSYFSEGLTDAGVSGSRLDDRLTGLERPVPLGGLDDGHGQTVLHGRQGVEVLALGVDGTAGGTYPIRDLDEGRVPHGLADVFEGGAVPLPPPLRAKAAGGGEELLGNPRRKRRGRRRHEGRGDAAAAGAGGGAEKGEVRLGKFHRVVSYHTKMLRKFTVP